MQHELFGCIKFFYKTIQLPKMRKIIVFWMLQTLFLLIVCKMTAVSRYPSE